MKFKKQGLNFLINYYENSKKEFEKKGINPFNSDLEFKQSYMTDLLRGMINNGCKIKGIPINNGWLELDSVSDYELYNELQKKEMLLDFYNEDD